ncbi:oxygenase MpaB family protein [Cellulomonas sp. NS3]|uniref:oxygenase MpaB family protein n=1 Tax=Cellulomonas sp. NS3 TaxID=2973977 RepID=UPI002161B782|nr:oxygenase MpaB family protein [Cellulomonas sp. NS3]
MSVAESARTRLATALLGRVAGDDHRDKHDRIHFTPGDRWFEPGSAIQRVHGDASMFVGGLRALLLQSLHPQAMAAVAGHSGYRGDPWGRLQRTSTFLAVTTFGTAADAERVVGHVRDVHERVRGKDEDGVPYRASDPHLLDWVHVAEVDSFLRAHQLYGENPLDDAGCDEYVAQAAVVARKLGGADVPTDVASLERALARYRGELRGTQAARDAARFLLVHPPLPLPARMPYGALAGAGVAMLPRWTRRPLGLPYAPPVEATVVRASGHAMVRAIRWALADF